MQQCPRCHELQSFSSLSHGYLTNHMNLFVCRHMVDVRGDIVGVFPLVLGLTWNAGVGRDQDDTHWMDEKWMSREEGYENIHDSWVAQTRILSLQVSFLTFCSLSRWHYIFYLLFLHVSTDFFCHYYACGLDDRCATCHVSRPLNQCYTVKFSEVAARVNTINLRIFYHSEKYIPFCLVASSVSTSQPLLSFTVRFF